MKYCKNYQNVTQRYKVSKYCWKNGASRLARHRVATNLQFVKKKKKEKKKKKGASLVAQWLRVCLPMQGTRVRALVQEDPTCRGATKPVHHNY